jgi:hypothetical protein
MLADQMLFKFLVIIEWVLFVITSLLLIILSVLADKLNENQFIRLFSFSGLRHEPLYNIKARSQKAVAVLLAVRANSIISAIILIISLSGIWFLLYKKYVNMPIGVDTILLGITAIIPLPIVIALFEFCLKKVIKRAANLLREGE